MQKYNTHLDKPVKPDYGGLFYLVTEVDAVIPVTLNPTLHMADGPPPTGTGFRARSFQCLNSAGVPPLPARTRVKTTNIARHAPFVRGRYGISGNEAAEGPGTG